MKFSEVVEQASALLQRKGRITYRALKREFHLEDDALEDLKFELIAGQELVVDKDGDVLVWVGTSPVPSSEFQISSFPQPLVPSTRPPTVVSSQSPASYTPKHLAERIRAEQAALEARSGTDGERKTITALFADLKGSTALIEGLDPEEARAIIDPALQLMMDAVHQYDGYVAQALGDGIFALFGAPLAPAAQHPSAPPFRGRFFTERRAESSFPRRRESRNPAIYGTKCLDARLRGQDGLRNPACGKSVKIAGNEKNLPFKARPLGMVTGKVKVPPEFFESLPEEILRAFEG